MSLSKKEYQYWDLDIVEIARKIKRDMMKEFPSIRVSVKSKRNENRINVKILEIHKKYIKDRSEFLYDIKRNNIYLTKDEYTRAIKQYDYTDYVVASAIKDEVWEKLEQIYNEYNYYNNDLERDFIDQRYYGGIQLGIGCKVIGE